MKSSPSFVSLGLFPLFLFLVAFGIPLSGHSLELDFLPDLNGRILDEQGQPLEHAMVFIWTAGPKDGVGIYCPSCYPDCGKKAATSNEGAFTIENLDPDLAFRILVVAKGFQPQFQAGVIPGDGPIQLQLFKRLSDVPPNQQVKGRVVDPEGIPIPDAVVDLNGVARGRTVQYGGNHEIDPLAVTDDQGYFTIQGSVPYDALHVTVEARGWAKRRVFWLETGEKVHDIMLTQGASIKGRLVQNGQGVSGITMNLTHANREASQFMGEFLVATDSDGHFTLSNLPPDFKYHFSANMDSVRALGAVPVKAVTLGGDHSEMDLGDVEIIPGSRLKGKIILSDGGKVPPQTSVHLSREQVWDRTKALTDEEGFFEMVHVPNEPIRMSTRVEGYRFSKRNRSFSSFDPFCLLGRMPRDKTDLILELEPESNPKAEDPFITNFSEEPLHGLEPVSEVNGGLRIVGSVRDADTNLLISNFSLTPSQKSPFSITPIWIPTWKTIHSEGTFSMMVPFPAKERVIRLEAEGYLPHQFRIEDEEQSAFEIKLHRSGRITGQILDSSGSPVSFATLYLLQQQSLIQIMDPLMKVREDSFQPVPTIKSDTQGRFTLNPDKESFGVCISEEEGFVIVSFEELEKDSVIRLQSWAQVEGVLKVGRYPAPGQIVCLQLTQPQDYFHPMPRPSLFISCKTTTDEKGAFHFPRVPSLPFKVFYSPRVTDRGMGGLPVSQPVGFLPSPGETYQVSLGGQGRDVLGKAVLENSPQTIHWRDDVHHLYLMIPPPEAISVLNSLYPEWQRKMALAISEEEKKKLTEGWERDRTAARLQRKAFYHSPEGLDYFFRQKSYALIFSEDGSFRIPDVPSGKYRLDIRLNKRNPNGESHVPVPQGIAHCSIEVEIPEGDLPFDMGNVRLELD